MTTAPTAYTEASAIISPCGLYRYELRRRWAFGNSVIFIGLNPSTADASVDDATIKTCVRYAKRWGSGSLIMLNLFALRSRDPKALLKAIDPIGPETDDYIRLAMVPRPVHVVAAWGAFPIARERARRIAEIVSVVGRQMTYLSCLVKNADGSPHHPLYLPSDLTPQPYTLGEQP
jgi:hypothetical protein